MTDIHNVVVRPNLSMRLPGCCHYEENRKNRLEYHNYVFRNGWLPCGDNWWDFPIKNIKHHHIDTSKITVLVKSNDGTTRKLSWE